MNKICVLGSINMDMVISVDRIPGVGETIFGHHLEKFPGGKGANQGVAMSRLGQEVSFIGCVGNDENGNYMLDLFAKEGMDTSGIAIDPLQPTGIALINVDASGNNNIIVVSGSNHQITPEDIRKVSQMVVESNLLVTQFEVPMNAILEAFKLAKSSNVLTVLNPSPVLAIPDDLYALTDFLVPNEYEAQALTGNQISTPEDALIAAKMLVKKGVSHVILTLGSKGAVYASQDNHSYYPALKVEAIDTTAAGDAFLGAFCSQIDTQDLSLEAISKSIEFANQVAAIVVQRKGAQNSLPYLTELTQLS